MTESELYGEDHLPPEPLWAELSPVLLMLEEVATTEAGTPIFADLCTWWDRHGITDEAERATWHALAKAVIHERAQLRSEEVERMREEAASHRG